MKLLTELSLRSGAFPDEILSPAPTGGAEYTPHARLGECGNSKSRIKSLQGGSEASFRVRNGAGDWDTLPALPRDALGRGRLSPWNGKEVPGGCSGQRENESPAKVGESGGQGRSGSEAS